MTYRDPVVVTIGTEPDAHGPDALALGSEEA